MTYHDITRIDVSLADKECRDTICLVLLSQAVELVDTLGSKTLDLVAYIAEASLGL